MNKILRKKNFRLLAKKPSSKKPVFDLSLFASFHSLLDWLEFWALILSVNYKAKETLNVARNDVPKLIESTFLLHRGL
jgi:hypothetical protein